MSDGFPLLGADRQHRLGLLQLAISNFRSDGAAACLAHARAFWDFVDDRDEPPPRPVVDLADTAPAVTDQAERGEPAALAPGAVAAPSHIEPPPAAYVRAADRALAWLRQAADKRGQVDRASLERGVAALGYSGWGGLYLQLRKLKDEGSIAFGAFTPPAKLPSIIVLGLAAPEDAETDSSGACDAAPGVPPMQIDGRGSGPLEAAAASGPLPPAAAAPLRSARGGAEAPMPSFGRALPKPSAGPAVVAKTGEVARPFVTPEPPPLRAADRLLLALRERADEHLMISRAAIEQAGAALGYNGWSGIRFQLIALRDEGLVIFGPASTTQKMQFITLSPPMTALPHGTRAVRGAGTGPKPIAKGDEIACLSCGRRFTTSGKGNRLCGPCQHQGEGLAT